MTKNVIKIQLKVKERLVFDLSTRTHILPMERALEMSCQDNACQGTCAELKQKDEDEAMDEPKLKAKAELTYASLPELVFLPLLSHLAAGE